jgi:hypothetical protein
MIVWFVLLLMLLVNNWLPVRVNCYFVYTEDSSSGLIGPRFHLCHVWS